MFLVASISVIIVAIFAAFAAIIYTSYYGLLGALVVGLSVGAGFLFSDGIFYITDKGGTAKLLGFGLFLVVSTVIVMVVFPANQHKIDGKYYLNLAGQLVGIPFVFSIVAFIHTTLLSVFSRRKHPSKADKSHY